jgi:ABC-type transport system involved in multi-copper enzyme maturation permease subunit
MSTTPEAARPALLVRRQIAALLRLEVRKGFLSRRALPVYLLAALPLLLGAAGILGTLIMGSGPSVVEAQTFYAHLFLNGVLMVVVFFGSAGIFMNLFRGDLIDRSLHYYFLAPLRREVLVLGKLLAGLVGSTLLFSLVAFVSYLLVLTSSDPVGFAGVLTHEGVFGQAFGYVFVTGLACLGYGAVFLLLGLFLRNPLIPAVLLWGWESINFLLPPLLQQASVIHYLKGLTPMPVSEGPFAFVGESPSLWTSTLGLIALVLIALAAAAWRVRRMEVRYESD